MAWNLPSRFFSKVFISPLKCNATQFSTSKNINTSHINSLFKLSRNIPPSSCIHRTVFVIKHSRADQHFVRNFCHGLHKSSVSSNQFCFVTPLRTFSSTSRCFGPSASAKKKMSQKNKTAVTYILSAFIFMIGGAYAGVPLYKVFCQATGLGGQPTQGHDTSKIEDMQAVDRQIKVRFNADTAASMRWNFRPQQYEVTVAPGETALAFYTAMNPTDKPIIGISTYNVLPVEAGQYFNKIQCFCFEEQRLNPKEQVDMPVFFYIDPEFAEDPKLENTDVITLSYTFFEAKEGLQLPLPGYTQPYSASVA